MVRFRSFVGWAALMIMAVPCLAQTTAKHPARAPLGYSIHSGGIGRLVPGQWGAIGTEIVNPGDQAVDVLTAIHFQNHPNLQFGRQMWVPARSRLLTSFPVLTPTDVPRDNESVEVQSLLLDRTGRGEVLIQSNSGQMLGDASLATMLERPLTAMIGDVGDESAGDAVMAMRVVRNLTRRVSSIAGDFAPPNLESLRGLDQLVLMSDSLAKDSAGLSAVREWVHNGGRLWLMLDQVAPDTVQALLGDSFTYHVVDRVGLTKFTMKSTQPGGLGPSGLTQEHDDPIDFVRVLTSQGSALHTLDGWPASFFFSVGRGRVLCTTVGARAWIRLRGPQDPQPKDVLRDAQYRANDYLTELAFEFLGQPSEPPPLKPADFQEFVSGQIGYRVVSRNSVLLVLGIFCTALIACGSWLAYRDQLPHLGWLGPLSAVGAATMLVLLGSWSRGAVPSTLAIAQIAEVSHDADDLQLTGLLGLYQQTDTTSPLGAQAGGVFLPDMTGQEGKTRRLVWTDLQAWHWENMALPAGIRTAPFHYSGKLAQPIQARATFGPAGLVGTLEAEPFRDLADALVVMPGQPILAANLAAGGKFTSGPGDVLAAGEFIGGTILSDERRRRRAVYKKMLDTPANDAAKLDNETAITRNDPIHGYPSEPKLLVWAAPYDTQFTLPSVMQRVGSALLAIPLKFDHPAAGTSFVIPSPCVTYASGGTSGAYVNRERRWISAMNNATTTTLRFKLPREVLPMKIKQANLTVTIDAPGRKLSITAGRGASEVSLATRNSPVGTVKLNIDRGDVLTVDAEGTFLLNIDVGTAAGESRDAIGGAGRDIGSFPVWRIEGVQLEVTGIAE